MPQSINDVNSVGTFKLYAKKMIKECRFQQACQDALNLIEREAFKDLGLRDETTFVHWWTKLYYKAMDLRKMT